jgi:hypothetical protein
MLLVIPLLVPTPIVENMRSRLRAFQMRRLKKLLKRLEAKMMNEETLKDQT